MYQSRKCWEFRVSYVLMMASCKHWENGKTLPIYGEKANLPQIPLHYVEKQLSYFCGSVLHLLLVTGLWVCRGDKHTGVEEDESVYAFLKEGNCEGMKWSSITFSVKPCLQGAKYDWTLVLSCNENGVCDSFWESWLSRKDRFLSMKCLKFGQCRGGSYIQ